MTSTQSALVLRCSEAGTPRVWLHKRLGFTASLNTFYGITFLYTQSVAFLCTDTHLRRKHHAMLCSYSLS